LGSFSINTNDQYLGLWATLMLEYSPDFQKHNFKSESRIGLKLSLWENWIIDN